MSQSSSLAFDKLDVSDVVWLDQAQMIEVDRVMIDELHIELIQMMENAGRNLAQVALRRFTPQTVTVLAGTGGNGGGGLVAARHLHNYGVDVSVVLSRSANDFAGVPGHQLDVLQRMGVKIVDEIPATDLFVDALVGYSLKGAPRGLTGELIRHVNDQNSKVLALDIPSGLDSTDGSTPGDVVKADATMTLALPKIGLKEADVVGELFLADISVPQSVYRDMGLEVPVVFRSQPVVQVL